MNHTTWFRPHIVSAAWKCLQVLERTVIARLYKTQLNFSDLSFAIRLTFLEIVLHQRVLHLPYLSRSDITPVQVKDPAPGNQTER